MKIALCFSGGLRSITDTKEYWQAFIAKYDIDVYGSFWDDELPEFGDTFENFTKLYSPKLIEVDNYAAFKTSTQDIASLCIMPPIELIGLFQQTCKSFGQLAMYYRIWRCNMLTKLSDVKYDLVIRARIDTILGDAFEIIDNEMLNVPAGIMFVPSFPNSWGIADTFAYGRPKIMDYYSFMFLKMMEYVNTGHYVFPSEHFLSVHFSKARILIRQFGQYITIIRTAKGLPPNEYNGYIVDGQIDIIDWSDDYEIAFMAPAENCTFINPNLKHDLTNWLTI